MWGEGWEILHLELFFILFDTYSIKFETNLTGKTSKAPFKKTCWPKYLKIGKIFHTIHE